MIAMRLEGHQNAIGTRTKLDLLYEIRMSFGWTNAKVVITLPQ